MFDMDISAVKTNIDQGSSTYRPQAGTNLSVARNSPIVAVAAKGDVATDDTVQKKSPNGADLKKMTADINLSLEAMNTNIRFKYHDKTKELMVQVVDQTNDKVLREIPSHEFLNTIAAIREYVGMILDKKM